MFDITEELKKLPASPGVYIMHDAEDVIIYVGKAISLKSRVRQYFQSSRNKGLKIERMVPQIARFEYIITDSEVEALVLECNLIKEHRPKYNTMLKDDKSYPFVRVTVSEPFPRVLLARRMQKDKDKYFGPYPSGVAVKDAIELIRKLYQVRSCNRQLPRDEGKERPCLYHHIKQCDAPCQGYITQEQYHQKVSQVLRFLNGDFKHVVDELQQKMNNFATELDFEMAAEYRDLIKNVKKIGERQKVTAGDGEDKDVIAAAIDEHDAVVQVFFIRDGRLIGRDHFYLKVATDNTKEEIITTFIKQFYAGTPFIPKELMLQIDIPEAQVLSEWLSQKRKQKVYLRVPKKGTKEKLVELAARNAEMVLSQDREKLKREEGRTIGAVKEIATLLGMEQLNRIEAFDISNISGFESVGSMVVYEKGKPKRSDYRKFKIRSVIGPNDYASMEEVLSRRFDRGIKEQKQETIATGFSVFPDVIMMDGGKGQVNIALEVLAKLGIDIAVCGMVKDDKHRTRGLYYQGEELSIDTHSEGFRLITRIQDEAHRFAIEYHRMLRGKGQVHSVLDDIPGIGPSRRKALMKYYQSLDKIKAATIDELSAVPTMNIGSAKKVYNFFHDVAN
jgi:excinuclease ABC, C subunit